MSFDTEELCECGHSIRQHGMNLNHTKDASNPDRCSFTEKKHQRTGPHNIHVSIVVCKCYRFTLMDWITGLCVIPEEICVLTLQIYR